MSRYVTTNVRFEQNTFRELRHQAQLRRTTIASVVREAVERYLGRSHGNEPIPFGEDPADRFVGSFNGGVGDEGVNHDHYLYEWPKEDPGEAPRGGRDRS